MKDNMNHNWVSIRGGLCILAAIGLLFLAGCGGGDSSSEPQASSGGEDAGEPSDNGTSSGSPSGDESASPRSTGNGTAESTSPDKPPVTVVGIFPIVEKYEDGTPRRKWSAKKFSDNRIAHHGNYEELYSDGTKFVEGEYEDDKRIGNWSTWYPTGKLAKRGNYVDGKLDGTWEVFRKDGTLQSTESYKLGGYHGVWTTYFDDGERVTLIQEFRDGQRAGEWKEWYEPTVADVPDEFQLKVSVSYLDGDVHGERKQWHDNGQLLSIENFKEGKRHGVQQVWDKNGTARAPVEFVEGRLKSKEPQTNG
jgi:antitoxin component YwqK of YwqJK toxin-antitoxin module